MMSCLEQPGQISGFCKFQGILNSIKMLLCQLKKVDSVNFFFCDHCIDIIKKGVLIFSYLINGAI